MGTRTQVIGRGMPDHARLSQPYRPLRRMVTQQITLPSLARPKSPLCRRGVLHDAAHQLPEWDRREPLGDSWSLPRGTEKGNVSSYAPMTNIFPHPKQ
jgi:hypothetical protein